jgi:hypothetical protein
MFIVFIPAAEEVSVRYFNVLFFVPFLLLGFWLAFIREHAGGMALMIERSIMIVLIGIHVGVLGMTAQRFSNGLGSDVDNSVLGELYPMVTYMETVSGKDQKTIFFTGKKMYRKRFFKPLEALIRQNGGQMVLLEDDDARALPPGTRVFHIAKTSDEPRGLDERVEGDVVETYQVFQNITLFVLRK